MIEYITISPTTGERYICDSVDSNNRKISVVVTKDSTLDSIVKELVNQMESPDQEIYKLKAESEKAKEQAKKNRRLLWAN